MHRTQTGGGTETAAEDGRGEEESGGIEGYYCYYCCIVKEGSAIRRITTAVHRVQRGRFVGNASMRQVSVVLLLHLLLEAPSRDGSVYLHSSSN